MEKSTHNAHMQRDKTTYNTHTLSTVKYNAEEVECAYEREH